MRIVIDMASNVMMDFLMMVGNGLLVLRSRLVNWLVSDDIMIVCGLMNRLLVVGWGLIKRLVVDWGLVNRLVVCLMYNKELSFVARLLIMLLFVVHGLVMRLYVELGTINGFVDSVLVVVNRLDVVLVIKLMV
jgi:hypothetical protein